MSVNTSSDIVELLEKSVELTSHVVDHSTVNLLQNQSNNEESNKCGNAVNGRIKNRKRRRQYNKNKNNNKKWCKKFKRQPSQQQQHNKSDPENLQNGKNSNNNRKHLYGGQKHLKSIFKNISHRNHRGISKFFLPDKRLRKELIIPPTKFLLGGNISDPLNLNSLQDEALNASENAATPKSSPITTPPKIEVIIPPNIFDPLHLLQPVDSVEYEKLLTTPLKRKMKHRNRKKKPRKRHDSSSSTVVSTMNSSVNISKETNELVINADNEQKTIPDVGKELRDDKSINIPSTQMTDKDRCVKDLRLELASDGEGCNRKRKNIECPNNHKKTRRLDSMDKIVSPVIPQPGAWGKRPPTIVPMGAPRNRNRLSSTSTTEEVTSTCTSTTVSRPTSSDLTTATTSTSASTAVSHAKTSTFSRTENLPPKKRPEKAKYPYGNYCSYKNFAGLTEYEDVRLRVFKQYPYLFQNKDILDIGCHAGHVTIAVARMLNPKSVLGIDIASNLISRAQHNLSLFVKIPPENQNNSGIPKSNESKKKKHNKRERTKPASFYPISFGITYKGIPKVPIQNNDQTACSTTRNDGFPYNVQFKTMNYVDNTDETLSNEAQLYDLIVCLSVTKFIHLNFGDAGLKSVFKKMFNQLRPGGKLILEAQNWASYKRSKNVTQTIYNNYKSIEFFPNKFHEFLLSTEVGFSHSSLLAVLKHAKGYRRPLQLYVKGDFTPSQICWSDSYIPQTPYEEPYRAYYAQMRRVRAVQSSTVWQNDTPQVSSRITPSNGLSATSQYYNPLETDNYLPSYDNEIQTRHYCFVSPLYSTVWSPPPSGRKSASQTPLFGSIRKVDDGDENIRPHVYLPAPGNFDGRDSSRSNDDCSQSPRMSHVYAAATPESRSCREPDTEYCSPKGHVYATACDNSSSPQQYSGESSRSVEIEQEDHVDDNLTDV